MPEPARRLCTSRGTRRHPRSVAPRALLLAVTLALLSPTHVPLARASEGHSLVFSTSADRVAASTLDAATVRDRVFIFTTPDGGTSRVRFFLDDPTMSGTPRQIEKNAPWDFAGTNSDGTAKALDTNVLVDGVHTITAAIDLSGGGVEVVEASFTIANRAPSLGFVPASVSLSAPDSTPVTASTTLATSSGTAGYSVTDDAPWLSAAPTSGVTPESIVLTADPAGLSEGTHVASVTADAEGFTAATMTVTFVVGSHPPDQVHLAWAEDPSTSMTVVWHTTGAATSAVEYRPLGDTAWQVATGVLRPSGTAGSLHEVTLLGLTPSTSYEYRARGDGLAWSEVFTTRTAPARGPADFDAVYVADTGIVGRTDGLAAGTQQVIDEIAALDPLLVLPGGDYAYYNTETRFTSLDAAIDAWFNQMQPIATQAPMMPVYGNHEALLGEGVEPWAARFPTPDGIDGRRNYSFDVGDVHFVAIFAVRETAALSSSTVAWIEQDIQAAWAAGARWVVPYFHVSPFSDGKNHPSNLALREQLGPLFERLGVKVVLTSHDQSYERTYPLTDVPATNAPTSTSMSCYTMDDGVTWLKVSPGGKLSNKNQSFSQFATNPAPAYTAFRDNTMHHFARLHVSAEGSIRLDTYGVVGDGTPPVVVDSFEYTTGTCPPELVFDPAALSLTAPEGASKVQATATVGANDGGAVLASVSDDASWLTVAPQAETTPAPLTLTADPAGLAPGTYRATVTATAPGHRNATLAVDLTVQPSATSRTLMVSSAPDRSAPAVLEGRAVAGKIYAFLTPEAGTSKVQFYLDDPAMTGTPRSVERNAPWDFAGGNKDGTAKPFDTTTIPDGSHTITAAIDLSDGRKEAVSATFTVANAAHSLSFSPSSLSFVTDGNGTVSPQMVTLSASDGSVAPFVATDDAGWLTSAPSSGTTPAAITVSVDASGLSPGTYTGTVTATSGTGTLRPSGLGVTLTVTGSTSAYSLLVSSSPDRSSATPLEGTAASGVVYVFLGPEAGASRVRFFLDDPSMSGTPRQVEKNAPWDFAGSNTNGTARPFDTAKITNGTHTVTAAVDLASGGTTTVSSTFDVVNSASP
jgi:hypothetical protein